VRRPRRIRLATAPARQGRALAAGAANDDARGFAFLIPFDGFGDQFAVAVALDNIGECESRQAAPTMQGLATALDRAVRFEVLDEQFQMRLVVALDAEGAGDLAFGDAGRRLIAVG